MRSFFLFLFLNIITFTYACSEYSAAIPSGVYSNGADKIIIENDNIHFIVTIKNRIIDNSYKYGLKEGGIHIYGLVSNDFSIGVGVNEWLWDGQQIIKYDLVSKDQVFFTKNVDEANN